MGLAGRPDPAGYPDTWYARTAVAAPRRAALDGTVEADVGIVGGGLAGLTAAAELAAAGRAVALVEARRLGWGASGRNGGFVSSGYSLGLDAIGARVGLDQARALYALSRDGVDYVRRMAGETAAGPAALDAGKLAVIRHRKVDALRRRQDRLATVFGHETEFWPEDRLRQQLTTDRYRAGLFDPEGFHLHPLNYALALAKVASQRGARLFEDTPATTVERHQGGWRVTTPGGVVIARDLLVCGGGYTDRLVPRLRRAMLPIATYVIVTEPLGDRLDQAVRTAAAIVDDRRASDYYRVVDGDRLLWGARITARTAEPRKLGEMLRSDLLDVYPQLGDVRVAHAWSGLMAYARHRMPQLGRTPGGVWYATAFGGHGLNTTAVAGRLVAAAIAEGDDRYRLFAPFGLTWNGGPVGPLAAQLTYLGYRIGDAWRERRWF